MGDTRIATTEIEITINNAQQIYVVMLRLMDDPSVLAGELRRYLSFVLIAGPYSGPYYRFILSDRQHDLYKRMSTKEASDE